MSEAMSYWAQFKESNPGAPVTPFPRPLSHAAFLREIGMTDEAQIESTAANMRRLDAAFFASYGDADTDAEGGPHGIP